MKTLFSAFAMTTLALGASCALAQDDSLALAEELAAQAQLAQDRHFYTIPLCQTVEGRCEVSKPGRGWEEVERGKYYPLGSTFRTIGDDAKLELRIGREYFVKAEGNASFGTLKQKLGVQQRTVVLHAGLIQVTAPSTPRPEGLFVVASRGFKVLDPRGGSRFTCTSVADGEEIVVRCVTGLFKLEGRHFSIPEMNPANEIRVTTSQDALFTAVTGLSGEIPVKLDQGMVEVRDVEKNEVRIEHKFMDWKLTQGTTFRIHRARPAKSDRLSVSVMTFDVNDQLKNRTTFVEGLYELNTGDEGPVSKAQREKLAKEAKEATASASEEAAAEEVAQ